MRHTIPKKEYIKAAGFVNGILERLFSEDEVSVLAIHESFTILYKLNLEDTNNYNEDIAQCLDTNLYATEYSEYCIKGRAYASMGSTALSKAIGAICQFFGSVMDAVTGKEVRNYALDLFNEIIGMLCPALCDEDMGCWGKFNIG